MAQEREQGSTVSKDAGQGARIHRRRRSATEIRAGQSRPKPSGAAGVVADWPLVLILLLQRSIASWWLVIPDEVGRDRRRGLIGAEDHARHTGCFCSEKGSAHDTRYGFSCRTQFGIRSVENA